MTLEPMKSGAPPEAEAGFSPVSPWQRRLGHLQYVWKNYSVGYLFILPWFIGFAAFVAIPVGWSLFTSFQEVCITPEGFRYNFVGLDNYRRALTEDNIYPIQLITYFQEMLLVIPIILIFAFLVALMLNQPFRGRTFLRAIFFLPVIFATGQVLTELFSQGAGELPFLEQYNIESLVRDNIGERMAEPILNVLSRVVIILWYSGVQILIYIAGFQTIPKTIYEAIRIDGASPWESFWKITLPGMVPFIGLNAVFTIVDLFTFPFNPVLEHVRANMFRADSGYGYASALAWLYFALILILLGFVFVMMFRTNRRRGGVR